MDQTWCVLTFVKVDSHADCCKRSAPFLACEHSVKLRWVCKSDHIHIKWFSFVESQLSRVSLGTRMLERIRIFYGAAHKFTIIKHINFHIGTRLQPPSEYADEICAWPLNFLSMGPWPLSSTYARKVAQNLQWMSELKSIIHNFLQNFHITPEWGLFNLELARASSMCKVESSSGSSLWPCSKMKINAKRTVV